MTDLLNEIRQAQINAGENAVIESLRKKRLVPNTNKQEKLFCVEGEKIIFNSAEELSSFVHKGKYSGEPCIDFVKNEIENYEQ